MNTARAMDPRAVGGDRISRIRGWWVWAALLWAFAVTGVRAEPVMVLTVQGAIGPASADYVIRGLQRAQQRRCNRRAHSTRSIRSKLSDYPKTCTPSFLEGNADTRRTIVACVRIVR